MWHVAVDVALRHALLGMGGEGKTRANLGVTAVADPNVRMDITGLLWRFSASTRFPD